MHIKTSLTVAFLLSAISALGQTTPQSSASPAKNEPVQATVTQNTSSGGVSFHTGQTVTLEKDPGKGFSANVLVGNRKIPVSMDYLQVKSDQEKAADAADGTVVILRATYGIPGQPLQQVTSKLRSIVAKGNVSATNPIRLTVNENLAYYQTQTEATYHGSITSTGRNSANFTVTKDAGAVLTVIYTVDGKQKMQQIARGDVLVLP